MAEAPEAQAVVEEFLARQRAMYARGDLEAAEELLAENVVWHVPGTSPIAGDYRGREAVSEYFRLGESSPEGLSGSPKEARRTTRRRSSSSPTVAPRLVAGRSFLSTVRSSAPAAHLLGVPR